LRSKRVRLLALSLSSLLLVSASPAFANPPKKPTLAQIEAAKKAEAEKKKLVDAANARLAKANLTLRQLAAVANAARIKYEAAKRELAVKTSEANAAAAAYNAAVSEVKAAHDAIGRLATNAYIMGGGFTDLDSLLHSDGPQDLMDRLSTLDSLGTQNTQALFRFKAAEEAAKVAKKKADTAKTAQEVATKKVEATKIEADAARNAQQKEVDKLQKIQDQVLKELNAARRTRVTLEQQRQLALLEENNAIIADNTAIYTKVWPDIGFKGRSTSRSTPALNQLVPGDLLFYSYKGTVNTIHHISIYAGDGMMWEANSTKTGLKFSNIYSIKGLMPYGGRV